MIELTSSRVTSGSERRHRTFAMVHGNDDLPQAVPKGRGDDSLGGQRLVGDLPDVAARIAEAGGADSPGAIHRPVQQLDPARFQLLAHCIHVVDAERELKSHPGVGSRDRRRRNKLMRLVRLQQVDKCLAEFENSRVVVLENHRESKDLAVEAFRLRQVLDEERDRGDRSGPRCL
jgi:hypothetical protein